MKKNIYADSKNSIGKKTMTKEIYNKKIWHSSIEHKPTCFEIVLLELETGKIIPGWWNGYRWEARRLKDGDKVVAFKFTEGSRTEKKEKS
jgi:hypothetical protein